MNLNIDFNEEASAAARNVRRRIDTTSNNNSHEIQPVVYAVYVNIQLIDRLCTPVTEEEIEKLKEKDQSVGDSHYYFTKNDCEINYDKLRDLLQMAHLSNFFNSIENNTDEDIDITENEYVLCSVIEMLISYRDYHTISNILNMDLKSNTRKYLYEFICHKMAPTLDGEGDMIVEPGDIPSYDLMMIRHYEELMEKIICEPGYDKYFDPCMELEGDLFQFTTVIAIRIDSLLLTLEKHDLAILLVHHNDYEIDDYLTESTLMTRLGFNRSMLIRMIRFAKAKNNIQR